VPFSSPTVKFVWGCISISYIGINTKAALYGVRFLLGVIEAGFFVRPLRIPWMLDVGGVVFVSLTCLAQPGVLLYMSLWYRKMELARRFSVFYAASLVSGAFGGLLGASRLLLFDSRAGLIKSSWSHFVRYERCTRPPSLEVALPQ
jgi:hypothetical protein